MFLLKAKKDYPKGKLLLGAPLGQALALLTNIGLGCDKHSSLLRTFINDIRKKFYNIVQGLEPGKLFS